MILTSAKLLSTYQGDVFIDNGAIVFKRDTILDVGPVSEITKRYNGHRIHRIQNAVLMPGLVNVHTHLELPPLLNKIKAKNFSDWVLNLIKVKKDLSSKDYKTAVSNNIEELIKTGTTTAGEICTHGVSPALLERSGLRAVVFNEVISMSAKGKEVQSSMFNVQSLNIVRPNALLKNGISPHTPYTVSESVLLQIKRIAQQNKLQMSMHVAESKDEIRLLQRKKSALEKLYQAVSWDMSLAPSAPSSFEYLDKVGLLNPCFLAVHAVQVTDRDIQLIKRSRTPIAHCPRSNKETGVGRLPLKKLLDAGVTVGLGTDSLASVRTLNMWDEMRYAYRVHKKDGVTAEDIIRLATIGGAKALGMDKEIGTLEPGKKADIIAVPLPERNTGDIYSDLLRETESCIMNVVNGKVIWSEPTASAS